MTKTTLRMTATADAPTLPSTRAAAIKGTSHYAAYQCIADTADPGEFSQSFFVGA